MSNYENKVAQIEAIIRQLESGSLPLEEVFKQFAIAVQLLDECDAFLGEGKERMQLLIEHLENRQGDKETRETR